MSKETISDTIQFIKNNAHHKDHIFISFYGGEALLDINTILLIINDLNSYFGDRISFDISTNGFLLTPKNIDRLLKFNVDISVSLDGCREIHDKNRKTINGDPTYDIIVTNLLNFKNKYPSEYNKRIRILITSGSLKDIRVMNENYDSFKELIGEKPLLISRIYPNFNKGVIYDDNNSDIIDFFKIALEHKKEGLSDLYTFILKDLSQKNKKYFKCNSNSNSSIINLKTCFDSLYNTFIDVNGNISPCEKFDSNHHIGNVKNGIDVKLMKKWAILYSFRKSFMCRDCDIIEYCSRCLADLKMRFSEQKIMCKIYKKNINLAIKLSKENSYDSEIN